MTGYNPNRTPAGSPDGGKFASGDAGKDETYEVDDAFGGVENCPICDQPIDYCQGHGEFNSSEEMEAGDVRVGDKVYEFGKVTDARRSAGDVVLTNEDGETTRYAPGEMLHVVDDEREDFSPDEFGVNTTIEPVSTGVWKAEFVSDNGKSMTVDYYGPHHPTPNKVMDGLAANAREIDGMSYEDYARSIGYEPDDDVRYEYNQAVNEARELRAVLGDEGYAAMVFGSREAEFSVPEPISEDGEYNDDWNDWSSAKPISDRIVHDDSHLDEQIAYAKEESVPDYYVGNLSEVYGYTIEDDDAEEVRNDPSWGNQPYIRHNMTLDDGSGNTIDVTFSRGMATRSPDARDVMESIVSDVRNARDAEYDADVFGGEFGMEYDEAKRMLHDIKRYDHWLGDRAEHFLTDVED